MTSEFYFVVNMMIYFTVFIWFTYYPFRDKFNVNKKKLLIILYSIFLILITIWIHSYYINDNNYFSLISLKLIYTFIFISISYVVIRVDFFKFLFTYIIKDIFIVCIYWNTSVLDYLLFNNSNHLYPSINTSIILIIQLLISIPLIMYLIKKIITPTLNQENNLVLKYTFKILFPILFLTIAIMIYFDNITDYSLKYTFIKYIMIALIHNIIKGHIKILCEFEKIRNNEKQISYTTLLVNLLQQQYNNISKHITETKAIQHDLRHHALVLSGYIESKDYDNLSSYVKKCNNAIPYNFPIAICNNYSINALLTHYLSLAEKSNINMDIKLDLENNIPICDCDLAIIYGNCIENALEACLKIPIDKRSIIIRSIIHNSNLLITIDNSFDGKIKEKDGRFLSSKRNFIYEGIGISSVRNIIDKYNGIIQYDISDKQFKVSICLKIENK